MPDARGRQQGARSAAPRSTTTPVPTATQRALPSVDAAAAELDRLGIESAAYPPGTDPASRAELLSGAHSLWYEYARPELHQALADLDEALTAVPEPIRIAIGSELETEARQLAEASAEYAEGTSVPEVEGRRSWEFGQPFVTYDGGVDMLSHEARERLDRLEEGITPAERATAVANLRVLVTACSRFPDMLGGLEEANLEIFAEPYGSDGYFLTVQAPNPGDDGTDLWNVEVGRWVPDDPDEDYEECGGSATGNAVVGCVLPASPGADEIADLLNRIEGQPDLLAQWATAPVGGVLAGTGFVVTERYDH
ncbi:hypothetical protein AB0O01_20205 [Streptomyces sp. NPDC093252]|uniref:hypothetical protein n=1 Tax=Streptomyces sp. NPDC093252 TaxID=3154980 RepID=UPI00341F21A5